jgi:opacity protein-like surface antigen
MTNKVKKVALAAAVVFLAFAADAASADKISVKITGGLNYGVFGDVNAGMRGYLDYWRDAVVDVGGTYRDGKKPLHTSATGAIDVLFRIDSSYSVGLGIGFVRAHNTSSMAITVPGESEQTGIASPDVRAVPVRLSIYKMIPINKKISTSFGLGVDTYIAQFRSYYLPAGAGNSIHQKAHAIGLGVRYGAGLEFKLVSRLAFVVEVQGTYAKVRNFHGTLEAGGSSLPYEESGTLYYWEQTSGLITPKSHAMVMIQTEKPSYYSNVRKANVDFSGFSVLAGFKFRL